MHNYILIDKLLNKKNEYTMNDLCKYLKEDEKTVRKDLLAYLYKQILDVAPNVKISSCKNMYKVFKYFEHINLEEEKIYIANELNRVEKLCNKRLKRFKNDNNIYTKILSIINITYLSLYHEENINNFKLMKYIIFGLKNYNYVFELTKTFPKYLNASNENSIFEEVIKEYVKDVKEYNFDSNTIYFERIIKLFMDSPKFKLSNEEKISILRKTKGLIKEIKNSDIPRTDKDKAIFFLNELINDINKNNNSNINDLYFKFDINNVDRDLPYIFEKKILDPNSILDLREKNVITIDGSGTLAYDDACSIERMDNGDYLVSVFVTDVASYVPRNSVIDKMAYEKSETLYMPRNVITMLPSELTTKLTLKERNDRQAIGHFFVIDKDMKCIEFNVHKCIINVNKNYSYNDVTRVIKNNKDIEETVFFNNMMDVALKLHGINNRQNYREIKSLKNNNNFDSSIGNIMIVEFMTLTNSYIASIFNDIKYLPFIYRINTGTYSDEIKNEMYNLLSKSRDTDEVKDKFDRLCPPSIYSTVNMGHSGLNLDSYCHSTNPLRNYASLECQRLIIEHLINQEKDINIEKQKKYEIELCNYMNNRINLNKAFIEECSKIKIK